MEPIEWIVMIVLAGGSYFGMNWTSPADPGYTLNCGRKVYY